MNNLDNFRLELGGAELVPIVIGGMGVDISTAELALEAARLGGVGHISDAMSLYVSDKRSDTGFTCKKFKSHVATAKKPDKSSVHFDLADLYKAQYQNVVSVMERKIGSGLVFINVMEKLTMADPVPTLNVRLRAALDAGIEGITLSAGLHMGSLKLIEDHPRFKDALIGIIVSSPRALKIFLRAAAKTSRLPDYIIVEGPLAGGHLGFGEDWKKYNLKQIMLEVINELQGAGLSIPVIPAGGVFTGTDAVELIELGAKAVQVATRFTVTKEAGLPDKVKQAYFKSEESDVVVSSVSPTGYPLRLLKSSPCFSSNVRPNCEAFGYVLKDGTCPYITAYENTGFDEKGRKLPVLEKICLCYHFSKAQAYTCGHYVYRLKDTTWLQADGNYQLLNAEDVFHDYQYSADHAVQRPPPVSNMHATLHIL